MKLNIQLSLTMPDGSIVSLTYDEATLLFHELSKVIYAGSSVFQPYTVYTGTPDIPKSCS